MKKWRTELDDWRQAAGFLARAEKAEAEVERLKAALRDAHKLIDNDLVNVWIMAHKLDDVLL
jgi:hypothetical protein